MHEHCRHNPIERWGTPPPAEAALIEQLLAAMDRPDDTIQEVAVGSNFLAMRTEKGVGLASTLAAGPAKGEEGLAESLVGMSVSDAARLLHHESPFAVSLGAAALNSGLTPPACDGNLSAADVLAEHGQGKDVVLVGEFPFAKRLAQEVGRLHVFDLEHGISTAPCEQWEELLAGSPVVGLTGTTLLTRAMAWFLERCQHAFTVVIGPTTPLCPVLFDHGADLLAGSRVVQPEPVFEGIRANQSFRQFKRLGVNFLTCRRPKA